MPRGRKTARAEKQSSLYKIFILLLIVFFTAPLITYVYPFTVVVVEEGWTPKQYKNPDSFIQQFQTNIETNLYEAKSTDGLTINRVAISNHAVENIRYVEGRGWIVKLKFSVSWITNKYYSIRTVWDKLFYVKYDNLIKWFNDNKCGEKEWEPKTFTEITFGKQYQCYFDRGDARGYFPVTVYEEEDSFSFEDVNEKSWSMELETTGGKESYRILEFDTVYLVTATEGKAVYIQNKFYNKYGGCVNCMNRVLRVKLSLPDLQSIFPQQSYRELYRLLYGETDSYDVANLMKFKDGDWPNVLGLSVSADLKTGTISVSADLKAKPIGDFPYVEPRLLVVYSSSESTFRNAKPIEGWVRGYGDLIGDVKLTDSLRSSTQTTINIPADRFRNPGYYLVRVETPWGGYIAYEQKVYQVTGEAQAETGITPEGPKPQLPPVGWDVKVEKFTAEHIMATNIQGSKWVWKGLQASWKFKVTVDTKGYERQIDVKASLDAVKLDKPYYNTGECKISATIISEKVNGVKEYVYESSCRYIAQTEDPNIPFKEYYANFILRVDGVDQDYKQFKTQIIEPRMPNPSQLQEVLVASGGTIPNAQKSGTDIAVSGSQSSSTSSTSISVSSRPAKPNVQTVSISSSGSGTALIDFGDGARASQKIKPGVTEVSHEYSKPGNYTVTVAVIGEGGEILNVKKQYVTVYEAVGFSVLDYLSRVLYFWYRLLFGWWLK